MLMLICWLEAYGKEKHRRFFFVGSNEIGLEVNADKILHIVMSRDQNAGRSNNMKNENSSFERVEMLKYLEANVTNQNSIPDGIKSRLKSGNTCCHSVQNHLSSSLLSKNLKVKFCLLFYECETWSFTLRVLENRVLRRISEPKKDDVTGEWRKIYNEKLNDL